ncbi:MAG: pseudouridine synthase, partial [Rhodospirillales bacterium]|nr:pseudouridine synthase [Rhodospirillales bacterium]
MTEVQMMEVGPEDSDLRLDRWFKRHFPELAHGRLEKLLRTGQVRVDGKKAQSGDRVVPGQSIRVPPLGTAPPRDDRLP